MTNTHEQLKNTVRRITEPCMDCGGMGILENGKDIIVDRKSITVHCNTCQGLGWCPKLEFGVELKSRLDDGISYMVSTFRNEEQLDDYEENLGKPLTTREVLLALSKKDVQVKLFITHILQVAKFYVDKAIIVDISLEKDPIDWDEETINKVIELLK